MAAVHTSKYQNAQFFARQTLQFFGWKILPGALLPVVLVIGLIVHSVFGTSKSAEGQWRAAEHALWVDGDVQKARALYESVLIDWPASSIAGEAHAGIALLLEMDKYASPRIAKEYASAARLSPENPNAGDWWITSGNHWQIAGENFAAQVAYEACIARHPSDANRARLALANLQLAQGEIDLALELFQTVTSSKSSSMTSIARMGISVCYERMGDLDAALAELDDSEEQWSVRRSRMVQRSEAIRH